MERMGRYQLREPLGRGGMASVFRAWDPQLGREVAVKVLSAGRHADRFQREVAALVRLQHPHVVPVFDAGVELGRPYLVMPVVEGPSLEQRLRSGPLPPGEALRLARTLADALNTAHAAGLVHRDVKPANVLLDGAGRPLLTDFGLVKDLNEATRSSQSGAMMGTPGYWAPEQAQGRDDVGPATDVYGLGATLYAALTGAPPVGGETLVEVLANTVGTPPRPPSQRGAPVSPDVDALVLRCLAKRPEERFPSMGALLLALDHAAERLAPRPAPGPRSAPSRAGLVAAAVLAAGVLAALGLVRAGRPAEPAPTPPPGPVASASPAPPADPEPAPSPPDDPGAVPPVVLDLVRQAIERSDAGDPDGALALVERALPLDPTCEALSARAVIRTRSGNLRGALADLEAASARAPERADLHNLVGWHRAQLGDPEGALEAYRRAVALAPEDAQVHLNVGLIYEGAGDFTRALEAAGNALALAPDNPWAWNNRGYARFRLGDLPGALEDYGECLRRDPINWIAAMNRGQARAASGDLEGALADFELALEHVPPQEEQRRAQLLQSRQRARATLAARGAGGDLPR